MVFKPIIYAPNRSHPRRRDPMALFSVLTVTFDFHNHQFIRQKFHTTFYRTNESNHKYGD